MSTQLIQSGGIQQTVDFTQSLLQIIYLDFDGELTSYQGEILTVDQVTVTDSQISSERIAQITAALNEQFAGQNVRFVLERPENAEYSTIYVGKTSAFEPYGTFAGLAETVDTGNQIKNDNAFVILDSTNDNEQIISTIAHEAGHLLGTLDHGGEGLLKYANDQRYYVSSGVTSTGITLNGGDEMSIYSGGIANNTTLNGDVEHDNWWNWVVVLGEMCVSNGGTANDTTINIGGEMHVSNGGVANRTILIGSEYVDYSKPYMNASMYVSEGGTANV